MKDLVGSVPLLHPVVGPVALAVLAGVVLLLWWRRTRRLRARTQVVLVLVALALAVGLWWGVDRVWRPVPDEIGVFTWTMIGTLTLVLLQALAGPWRTGRRVRQAAGSVGAAALALLAVMVALNAHFSTYATVGVALRLDLHPVPLEQVDVAPVADPATGSGTTYTWWTAPPDLPAAGTVVRTPIPASDPGFSPREAYVYLPPAYLIRRRPLLPVLVLVAGVPGSPSDWLTGGELTATMDAFAAAHHGLAPVVVVPDDLGGSLTNPLCSDAWKGDVATYLQQDVPAWVTAHLQVDTDHAHWAVGGISNGGTCALQVATRAPRVFPTFLDMSGELHPTLGTPGRTLERGFGGDEAALEVNDPLTLMARQRYPQVAGIVSVGSDDHVYRQDAHQVYEAARAAGMDVQLREHPGGHAWTTWAAALADQLPWLARRQGLIPPPG
ncbi:alpha/beta hydrolase [Ornithinimicrobium avium]|uniref:Esterase n=1 Tax=Ornithinimicrobium avium TaxID=2283195 RepID=A0A345NKX8_9MICO|nr:alpha/beta hydrolase-fold protein [Ornithinimicrobium avium]AXH95686.1 esterase [Ornithinimicrobium avium]